MGFFVGLRRLMIEVGLHVPGTDVEIPNGLHK
jgi:hypothetical protein